MKKPFKYNMKKHMFHKCKTEDGIYLESFYGGLMWACWNSYSNDDGTIREDTNPKVKAAIKKEYARLVKIMDKIHKNEKTKK